MDLNQLLLDNWEWIVVLGLIAGLLYYGLGRRRLRAAGPDQNDRDPHPRPPQPQRTGLGDAGTSAPTTSCEHVAGRHHRGHGCC